jgi:fission process protein 1
MALPAVTIHTAVKRSTPLFSGVKNVRLRSWGPTLTGLAVRPLPVLACLL